MKARLLAILVLGSVFLFPLALGCGQQQTSGLIAGVGEDKPGSGNKGERAAQGKPGAVKGKQSAGEQTPLAAEDKRRIAMVVAPEGYQDHEFEDSRTVFVEAGYAVDVVSLDNGEAKGALGGKVKVDLTLEQAVEKVGDFAAVVFIGGPGSVVYHENKVAHKLAQEAAARKKVVAAICLAPFTLAYAHVLDGVKATVWTGGKFTSDKFASLGPFYREGPVVTDGLFVTANGPRAAKEFAKRVTELLKTK